MTSDKLRDILAFRGFAYTEEQDNEPPAKTESEEMAEIFAAARVRFGSEME